MSKFTDFLNLFMWDSIEDSEEEFNIDKALNDNWKKIDTKVKTHVTSVNEEINNFKEETNQKIENIQALPVGGTKGQVLTKQSETEGDANWEDIEANEVFIGNEEEAPDTAKIIIEDEDLEDSAGLSKSEVYVGAEEPTTGEKVWFNKDENSIYVRNSNGVYEEFIKKSEEVYSTEEVKIGTWIDGKPIYRKVFDIKTISASNTDLVNVSNLNIETLIKLNGVIITDGGGKFPVPLYDSSSNYSVLFINEYNYIRGRATVGNGTFSKLIVTVEYTKTTD